MFRPTYYYMAADVIIVVILRLLYRLTAALFLPLTWRFLMLGSQFQLYLPVEVEILLSSPCLFHCSMPT